VIDLSLIAPAVALGCALAVASQQRRDSWKARRWCLLLLALGTRDLLHHELPLAATAATQEAVREWTDLLRTCLNWLDFPLILVK